MNASPVQVSFRTPQRGTGASTIDRATPPAPAPRPPTRRPEDWLIVAMLVLSLLIAISAAGVDASTSVAAPEVVAPSAPASAAPSGAGCTVKPDPTTGKGCLTPTTQHGLDELVAVFGPYRGGPTIRSASCWDPHLWNPTSDHPKGKACDLFPGAFGKFAKGAELDAGWAVARWLRANAGPLKVNYVIWQGRIWSIAHPDDVGGGWGRTYTGGGVYDPTDATGGHFDHVHVSFRQ